MVFSSNLFLFIFLPVTLAGYYLINEKLRNAFLLMMSLAFYAWGEPRAVLVMLASIVVNYTFGLAIHELKEWNAGVLIRRLVLFLVVAANLGILFYYKYLDFAIGTINGMFGTNMALRNIALPIGISFFTFQGMSYVLDLYMDKGTVQKNPLNVALYIALFPQLIAGPIVRYADVNEQIMHRTVNVDMFAEGVRRFAVGLAKKAFLANTLGQVADQIFDQPVFSGTAGVAWLGAVCYAFQIYFDFSGYSDMAIGLGRMFGFDFLENFNYPYISSTITEFWRRWHISLSSWFRDYVYIPLGGNRRGNQYLHQLTVFLLTGLWHGASWNFVLWGLWHGAFLMAEKPFIKKGLMKKIPAWVRWPFTMLIVLVGWVLFRMEDLPGTLHYLGVMFGLVHAERVTYTASWYLTGWVVFALVIAVLASVPWRKVFGRIGEHWAKDGLGLVVSHLWTAFLLAFSLMLCMTSTYNPFIYFRF